MKKLRVIGFAQMPSEHHPEVIEMLTQEGYGEFPVEVTASPDEFDDFGEPLLVWPDGKSASRFWFEVDKIEWL